MNLKSIVLSSFLLLCFSVPVFSQSFWNVEKYTDNGRDLSRSANTFGLEFVALKKVNGQDDFCNFDDKNAYMRYITVVIYSKIFGKDADTVELKNIIFTGDMKESHLPDFGMFSWSFSAIKINGQIQPNITGSVALIGNNVTIRLRDRNDNIILDLVSGSKYDPFS